MKNILVPTDFSVVADVASEYALKIAEKAKAEIHFLHIQYTPIEWVNLIWERKKLPRNAEANSSCQKRIEKMGKARRRFGPYSTHIYHL